MVERLARNSGIYALVLLALITAFAWWRVQSRGTELVAELHVRRPTGIMGTDARLVAVRAPGEAEAAAQALAAAEAELRRLEALMSTWIESSELSRLNSAPQGQAVPLSLATLEVIRAAMQAHADTGGAFDATCRPLIELWRQADKENVVPAEESIRSARAASQWSDFEIGDSAVAKQKPSARLDLGGIAKGYAIDRALDILESHGCEAGLVEVGGDLRAFGTPPGKPAWPVAIVNPSDPEDPDRDEIPLPRGHAICTSGDYARYTEIQGQLYSHIIDPRSGHPAKASASVTVIAKTAIEADIWATALSVLPFEQWPSPLPPGVSALGSRRGKSDLEHKSTRGFPESEAKQQ